MKSNKIALKLITSVWLLAFIGSGSAVAKIFHPESTAETAQVWGDLIVQSLNSNPEMKIRTSDRDIKLTNVHTYREGCMNGTYEIQKDPSGQGHILLDILSCERELPVIGTQPAAQKPLVCPEIYSPVCGLVNHSGYSDTRTFSNVCELNNNSALFLKHGSCQEEALK